MIFVKKFKIFLFWEGGQNEPRRMFHNVLDEKETILE